MSAPEDAPPLVVLAGPTGSGKTALALELAERFGAEIVSCDSVAVYREMEIGTAKPSPAERTAVPHHMLDVVSPAETFTAGEYSRQARVAIAGITARGAFPIVAGGTGLYLRALLEGLFPAPEVDPELRARLRGRAELRGGPYLHRLLLRLDATAAANIHPNDTPKLLRAIEVSLTAQQPLTEQWKAGGRDPLTGFRILRLGLQPPRELMYKRINARAERMFREGLLEETRALMERYGSTIWPLRSLGYAQALAVLEGRLSLAEAIAEAQLGHRHYAKRQLTWFRRDPAMVWLAGFGDEPAIVAEAIALCQRHLGT